MLIRFVIGEKPESSGISAMSAPPGSRLQAAGAEDADPVGDVDADVQPCRRAPVRLIHPDDVRALAERLTVEGGAFRSVSTSIPLNRSQSTRRLASASER